MSLIYDAILENIRPHGRGAIFRNTSTGAITWRSGSEADTDQPQALETFERLRAEERIQQTAMLGSDVEIWEGVPE